MSRRQLTARPLAALVTLALLIGFLGCDDDGSDVGPATPAAITAVSGSGQTGEPGALLPNPIVAKVITSSGAPVEGVTVNFVVGPGGSVSPASAATSSDGTASTSWTLGTILGEQTAEASVSGVTGPASFTAVVTAGPAASLEVAGGNEQNGIPGEALLDRLVVVARDAFGNPRSQVEVVWSVTSGGGSISPATSTTGDDGQAAAVWTLGDQGENTAQALAPAVVGAPPVTFHAVVISGSAQLSPVSGNDQAGAPLQPLPLPLVVSLTSSTGAPIAGVPVTWTISVGGGSVSERTTPTDELGQALVMWTLGATRGRQSVVATVSGAIGSPVTFDAVAANP